MIYHTLHSIAVKFISQKGAPFNSINLPGPDGQASTYVSMRGSSISPTDNSLDTTKRIDVRIVPVNGKESSIFLLPETHTGHRLTNETFRRLRELLDKPKNS